MRKRVATLISGIAISAMATTAQAVPIETWGYSISSSFIAATSEGAASGTSFSFTPGGADISWGRTGGTVSPTGGRSAIQIRDRFGAIGPVTGSIDTNGDAEFGHQFIHRNNIVPAPGVLLDNATAGTSITLTPTVPSAAPITISPQPAFFIDFRETPNAADPCPDGSTGELCPDIFVVAPAGGDVGFDSEIGFFFAVPFSYLGENYVMRLFDTSSALKLLSDEACATANADPGCIGFVTRERLATQLQLAFDLRRIGIAEPASIGLLGFAGLGLLSVAMRRRRA